MLQNGKAQSQVSYPVWQQVLFIPPSNFMRGGLLFSHCSFVSYALVIAGVSNKDCLLTFQFTDMYSRVKRKRKTVKRDMYGIPIEETSEEEDSEDTDDSSEGKSDS